MKNLLRHTAWDFDLISIFDVGKVVHSKHLILCRWSGNAPMHHVSIVVVEASSLGFRNLFSHCLHPVHSRRAVHKHFRLELAIFLFNLHAANPCLQLMRLFVGTVRYLSAMWLTLLQKIHPHVLLV